MTTGRAQPQRTCIACRSKLEKGSLIRFVLSPAGEVLVDYRSKLPGRGAYTCLSLDCVARAAKNGFTRSFKKNVSADAEVLSCQLQDEMEKRLVSLLGMTRKAGILISGSGQVLAACSSKHKPELIIMSDDISESIAQKLLKSCKLSGIKCFSLFSKDFLGQLLGKSERSVISAGAASVTKTLCVELEKYFQLFKKEPG